MRDTIAHAIRCGELLVKVKAALPYGQFLSWLLENITFSERLARYYIRLAGLNQVDRQRVADLTIHQAIVLFRKTPKPKPEAPLPDREVKVTKKKRPSRPTISNVEYRALRQKLVNSVIARCIPTVKRAAGSLLGTDELMQLRDAISAVVDQYINRADGAPSRPTPHLISVSMKESIK